MATLAGIALYPACRPRARLAQAAAWATAKVGGGFSLPWRSVEWTPPCGAEVFSELCAQWKTALGSFDAVAVFSRTQSSRPGLTAVLVRDRGPVGFVRVGQGGRRTLEAEERALSAVSNAAIRSFTVPGPLGVGSVAEWDWLATTALPGGLHQPARHPPIAEITVELQQALAGALPDVERPPHWVPMHGDLAPWNLRRIRGRRLALLDWQDATWGPPHADAVYWAATTAALRGTAPPPVAAGEAVDYWLASVSTRSVTDADATLSRKLLGVLGMMKG
ncbi:MAG: aminoglycoside phosphotransferase family protein [Euzebyales bacterium]|nr:aminoglycoside phosphotransferase family protein [Euzebyales bacterium]